MGNGVRFTQELKERAVRLVREQVKGNEPTWPAIVSVASKLGCSAESLRRWVRQAERDAGKREGLNTDEREELRRLQREVRELKKANEILRLASAFFAQAELDRLK
jgi:transposase-like protein